MARFGSLRKHSSARWRLGMGYARAYLVWCATHGVSKAVASADGYAAKASHGAFWCEVYAFLLPLSLLLVLATLSRLRLLRV